MWYKKTEQEVIEELNTDRKSGLNDSEVNRRIKKYGKNEFKEEKKKGLLKMIFEQINDVMIYILIAAAVASASLGEVSDAIIIGIVITLNAVIGIIQERKAEEAIKELKKLSSPKSLVKRNGKVVEVPTNKIVPGDIVVLEAGRMVPADLRLIDEASLKIEESSLTGESVPVEKDSEIDLSGKEDVALGDQRNMAFMSTVVTYGRGEGVVVGTAMDTEMGKIADLLGKTVDEKTPLQKRLADIGKVLGIIALIISAVIFGLGVIQGRDIFDMLFTAISLAVAAIPEGLPAIVTIVLAMGVQKMIKRNAIIRKLPAVETLGSVNIVCSDKTGTLTQNKMTVTKIYTNEEIKSVENIDTQNESENMLLKAMVLCNDATYTEKNQTGDPTEVALLVMGENNGLKKEEAEKQFKRLNEVPFESDRKMMTTINEINGEYFVFTKGAIDNLLKASTKINVNGEEKELTEDIKRDILNAAEKMSSQALRVLGAAYKKTDNKKGTREDFENDLVYTGLVGMIDPPREEVKASINKCHNAGIKTIMITGDHKKTAFAIAKELGIAEREEQSISGVEIDKLSEKELSNRIKDLRVFARVSPEHKVKIVNAFRDNGNVVSMTGDGVNDAPSLKAADIGVSMGITGTDVAKSASDMILTDDNFSTIEHAIEEGRNIYKNIKKTILFLLSCNFGEIIAIFLAVLFKWPTPLIPIHILWVNLITDSFPALALGVDPGDPDVMKEKPRDPKESIFQGYKLSLFINGLIIGGLTLFAFVYGVRNFMGITDFNQIIPSDIPGNALIHAQTMAFIVLSFSQLVHSLNLRSFEKSIFKKGLFTNKYLIGAILLGIVLQAIIVSVPFLEEIFKVSSLNITDWSIVLGLSIVPLIINEIVKIFKR
ncbi:cation-translocating P-type ATPase [Geotoga petraea]|jgi:Ca2+-transporting ATPase|uniref:Ca2+-transporting ATPase n=1 Tax=Geotoga petraea TaxID=28234 RepID=A0A1G6L5S6_9BACT|nr:cation-translocating P-type ATPase [Geotoga petraea]SDC38501.1 Ca2+-transporting ATPase [Geotoga petraea]